MSRRYELTSRKWVNAEVQKFFPSKLEDYGVVNDYDWTDFQTGAAISAFYHSAPFSTPSAMFEDAVRRLTTSSTSVADPDNITVTPVPAEVQNAIFSFRDKFQDWNRMVSIRPRTNHRTECDSLDICMRFAEDMEAVYNDGRTNVLKNPPTTMYGQGLCPLCMPYYLEIEESLAEDLWNNLPVWAYGKEWKDLGRGSEGSSSFLLLNGCSSLMLFYPFFASLL